MLCTCQSRYVRKCLVPYSKSVKVYLNLKINSLLVKKKKKKRSVYALKLTSV